MNAENLGRLANVIEDLPTVEYDYSYDAPGPEGSMYADTFCMKEEQHRCGSPACLLGWAEHIFGRDAYDALDLSFPDETVALFTPENRHARFGAGPDEYGHITAQHAAAVLRHAAKTGEIDWSIDS